MVDIERKIEPERMCRNSKIRLVFCNKKEKRDNVMMLTEPLFSLGRGCLPVDDDEQKKKNSSFPAYRSRYRPGGRAKVGREEE